jgi:tetratricopeptide (TPR) repeat protein
MRSVSQLGFIPKRLLPALIVLSAVPGAHLLARAQEAAQSIAVASPPAPNPTNSRSQPTPEQIGDAMLARRRYHEVIDAYMKIPNPSPEMWNRMGVSYQMLLDLKDALRCYKESLRLRPFNARTLNNLGSAYDSLGDHPKAERMYRQALKIDSTLAQAAMNLGTNLTIQHRYREGLEMYQRAASLDPGVLDGVDATLTVASVKPEQAAAVNYYKARSFARAGKTGRAIEYLRRAIDEGFANPVMIAQDSSFDKLRENLAFQRFLAFEQECRGLRLESRFPERHGH